MNFLSAIHRWPSNHDANGSTNVLIHHRAYFFDDSKRRVVGRIGHNNNFECRVVLKKDRAEVFFQSLVKTATGNKNGNEWRELWILAHQLGSYVPSEANPPAKRIQSEPNRNRGKKIINPHKNARGDV